MINSVRSIANPATSLTQKSSNQAEQKDRGFEETFQDIINRKQQSGMSGKDFVQTLDNYELSIIQKSKRIADQIRTEKLSAEGAENLFVMQGDDRKYVDLNDDGVTEIGEGKVMVFPPPNSSVAVKDAWDKTSRDMTFREKMLIQGRFAAQDLVRRLNGEEKSVYGRSDEDMVGLIDKIITDSQRYDNTLSTEHKEINDFVDGALEKFKEKIREFTQELK